MRVASLPAMEGSIDGQEWKLWRHGAPFPQRFSATISAEGDTIVGVWEKADDGVTFATDFDLIYRRIR